MSQITPRSNWLEEYGYEDSLAILRDFAWSHVTEAGPYRSVLGNFLRTSDWAGLCNYELSYDRSASPVHLKNARQALGFFQKLEILKLGLDKEQVAYEKFVASEAQCALSNRVFKLARKGEFSFSPFVNSVLYTAARKIARVLGPVPGLAELHFRFGPGATTTTRSSSVNWATKLNSDLACSTNLAPLGDSLAQQFPFWFMHHAHACSQEVAKVDIRVEPGKLQFVPKNAKTYRSIIVEPILNSFYQLGIGAYLRQRLRRVGVDLDDQSRNQALARSGSIGGSLATIDLSSASDTISRELVYELLPLDWSRFLETGRTSHVVYRGTHIHLEKFSSMGNGFTFELETLIFWALSDAVLSLRGLPHGWLSTYGDDIVIPVEAVPDLEEVFRSVGFTINMAKSFWSGPFRESCGKDFFQGIDIRPYYQKVAVSGESLFTLHNFYMRDFDFARARKVRRYIHPSLLIFGPDGYGDGHLIGTWAAKTRKRDQQRGWEGARFVTFQHVSRRLKRVPDTGWCLPTYCAYARQGAEQEYDSLVVSGSIGYKRVSIYTLARGVFCG